MGCPHLPQLCLSGLQIRTVPIVIALFTKEGLNPVFSSIFPKPLGIRRSENKPSFIFGVVLESDLEMV